MERFLSPLLLLLIAAGCATPPPAVVDAQTTRLASNARAAYERGAYPLAVRYYNQALQRARARDDGPEIARCAYNLAASQLALGQPAAARAALSEALVEFARYRMDAQPALLLDARAAQEAGQMADSRQALDRALAASKSDAQRQEVWLVRGELCARTNDVSGAAAALRQTESLANKSDAATLRAARLNLTGQVALLDGRASAAAGNFDAAAATWQQAGKLHDMADALGRAGQAYLQAGDAHAAADHAYRAARSLYAQGDAVAALQQIQFGLAANAHAADPELQALLTTLFNAIKQAIADSKLAEAPSAP